MRKETKLYIVCGYVASGKTTVSERLKEVTGADVIRTDDVRNELFPETMDYKTIDLDNPKSAEIITSWIELRDTRVDFQQVLNPILAHKNEAYIQIVNGYVSRIREQKEEVYNEAFLRLDKGLEQGRDMLFDATFSKKDMRERVFQVAIRNGIKKVYIIQIVCDEEVVEARLANRRSGGQITTSNAKQLQVYRFVKKEFDESRIQDDNPEDIEISRIVYDTGSQQVNQFGEKDEMTEIIRKDVIDVLSEKYKN